MSDRIAVMNGGEILQIGTPREIYDKPQHRFVAGFIGEINLVPVEAMGAHDYAITGVGVLRSDEASEVQKGSQGRAGESGRNASPCRRLRRANCPGSLPMWCITGTDTIFHIRLADGLELRGPFPEQHGPYPVLRQGRPDRWSVDAASVSSWPNDPS